MCPLFRGSTVLQGTVDLIPMCPLFRGSTVLQGTVDLIPMCPLFRGSTVLQGTVDLIPMCPLFRGSTTRDSRPEMFIQRFSDTFNGLLLLLIRSDMEHYKDIGCLTHLHVAYSQPLTSERSICSHTAKSEKISLPSDKNSFESICFNMCRDLMRLNWKELGSWIVKEGAYIYICG